MTVRKNDMVFANGIGWSKVLDTAFDGMGHLQGVWLHDADGDLIAVGARELWWFPTGSAMPARCTLGLGGAA